MRYKDLKELVLHHCHLYYDLSNPSISDKEFDNLYDLLEKTEVAQGWRDANSPTSSVGGAAGKVKHYNRLYSLRKVYEDEQEAKELSSLYDVKTPKIDGANLNLYYIRGVLKLALTRGNGELGDNVLHLANTIINIPKIINTSSEITHITGECVTDNSVENYRNYVSGALGLKDASEFKQRNILFIAHDYLGVEYDYTKRMSMLKSMGFNTVLDKMAENYPTDGVVYRIDSYKKTSNLGYTEKYPRFAVALKPRGVNTAITILQDVEWAVGRTGTVNPTGVISPVVIDDATITRVTLHNLGIILEHNLGIGDSIEVERAGGVIPKFLKVIEHSNHNIKITQEHAEKAVQMELVLSGPRLLVKDSSNVNTKKIVEHFVKIMDIKGLGPSSIDKMNIKHPLDIYSITDWSILGANGNKVLAEIERSKLQPYEIVLASLGIKGVGKTASKKIVAAIPAFRNLREIATTDIKTIGPSTISSVLSWLDANEEWVYKLPLQLEQDTFTHIITNTSKNVCITGKLDMSRSQLAEMLEQKGYKVTSTVTNDCYALITGGDTTSSKYKNAVKKNVTIIDYWSRKKDVLAGNF